MILRTSKLLRTTGAMCGLCSQQLAALSMAVLLRAFKQQPCAGCHVQSCTASHPIDIDVTLSRVKADGT
jgi:hypothetical protein